MKKRNYVVIAILLVLVLVLSATYSYARYLTSIDTSSDAVTAKWAVSVKEGSNELSSTQKLTLTVNENENVVAGKIAPGSTATGEFVIDPTGSEVAIDYEVKIDTTNMTNSKMAIESLKVDGTTLTKDVSGNYVGSISLADVVANKTTKVTVTVVWTNDENNNEVDTATGKAAGTIELPINIIVKQHIA